jgi:hypothetical protein
MYCMKRLALRIDIWTRLGLSFVITVNSVPKKALKIDCLA